MTKYARVPIRTISDGSKFRPEIKGPVKIDRDTRFLLCSDGLWEYVDERFMEKTIKRARTPRQWLGKLEERRDKRAPDDADNYSAIAVFI